MRKMYTISRTLQDNIHMQLAVKNKLGLKVMRLMQPNLTGVNLLQVICCVPCVVVLILLIPRHTNAQAPNMDAYIQYKSDFKKREMEFVKQLKETHPGTTKMQIKEELRQFYRDNFDPSFFPSKEESIEKTPDISKKLQIQANLPNTSTVSSTPFNQIPDALEYQALRDFFESTGGENWAHRTGWDYPNWKDTSIVSYLDFDNWFGITIVNGDVRNIDLSHNGLNGTLSNTICDLGELTFLNLYGNNFSGSLPIEIGQLKKITILSLGGNSFSGLWPAEIDDLQELTFLDLAGNSFSGPLPAEISNLQKLTYLDLGYNNFSGLLPAEIGQLQELISLDLARNNFSGFLPTELGQLQKLTSLNLARNNFSGSLPAEIGNLYELTSLNLSLNSFSGSLPAEIGQLRKLTRLNLYSNNFSGSLPVEIGQLQELTLLDWFNNDFSGSLPVEIGQLQKLREIDFRFNNFSGSLPTEIGQLRDLSYLDFSFNGFSGSLPTEIGQLQDLSFLDFAFNSFSGSLPAEIGQLQNLSYLDFRINSFSGSLPAEIGQLQNLYYLDFGSNNFSGSLPAEMGQLMGLDYLNLSNNLFSGPLSNEISGFQGSELHLRRNSFESVPDFSMILTQFSSYIDVSHNKIDWKYIEPNIQGGINSGAGWFLFVPQTFSEDTLVFWEMGSADTISVLTGGNQNLYRWERMLSNGTWENIAGQISNELVASNITHSDSGKYRLAVYNELAGGLDGPALFSGIITVDVVEEGDPPTVDTPTEICSGRTTTLTANGVGVIRWYADSLGGTTLYVGNSFTTPILTVPVTYYVSQTVGSTESQRIAVPVYVGPIFTATQNESLCLGESLPIVIDGDNLTVDWGSEIGALNSFVAQPDTTTTYSYTIEDAFGCTASGQVTITVNDPVDAEILPTVPVCPGQTATLEAVEVTGATYAWEPGGLSGRTVDVVINELQEYTLTVTSANGCSAQASILPEIQTIAVASEDREICVVDTVTLVAEGGDSYVWSTGDTIPEINFSRTIPGIYTLTVTATKDGCSASDDVVVTVNAFCPGTPISFMARAISTAEIELNWQEPPGNHTEYVIQRRNAAAVYETVTTLPVGTTAWPDSGLQPGTVYFYRIYSQVDTAQSEMRFARARTFTPNQNYVMETEVLTEGITDVAFVPNLNYHQRNSTWNYLNGLGSDMQTVVEGASPSEKDVVQPIIYDEYGMRSKQYLSYTIAQTTRPGNFRDSARKETTNFYADPPDGVANTSFPYAETVFDTSPQNKVLEQGSTGEAWQVSTRNTIKIDRTTNAASDVLHWKISGNQLEAAGYYPAAQLKKTVTVNEDDETVLLYEDMLGRELMRKIERAAGDIITYFVYNNRGSLLYRITPNVISGFTGLPPFTIDQNTLLTQCYSYRYDAQEKLIEEKWPDQEAIYYVYDQWDRLVLSQSGNQRQNNQWTFTKYDRFDRPVLTGLLDNADFTRSAMQSAIDNYYATGGSRYEAYEGVNGAVHGYTNDSYPVLADEQAYLSVTYYDSYDFIQSDTLFGAAYAYDSSMLGCQDSPQGEYCFPAAPLKILRGKVTGSKTKVLNQDQWLPGVVYYDDDGRTIQAIAQNHTGGIDRASTLHNFAGWPLMTYSTLNMPGTDNYAIQRKFVYDHAGRLKEGYHELFKNDVGQGEKFLAENVYNELGQLIEKNLHVEQDIPLQSVDYQYNIRGWLQSINNVQFSVDGRNNDINDLFGMEILYQNPLNGVQPGGN